MRPGPQPPQQVAQLLQQVQQPPAHHSWQQPTAAPAAASACGGAADGGLPGPGLHLLLQPGQAEQLCSQLAGTDGLNCLGFALHLVASRPAAATGGGKRQQRIVHWGSEGDVEADAAAVVQGKSVAAGVALSWRDGAAVYVPLAGTGSSTEGTAAVATLLRGNAADPGGLAIRASVGVQQQAAALQALLGCSVALPAMLVDTRVAAWLLNPSSASLKAAPGEALDAVAQRVLRQATRQSPLEQGAGAYAASTAGMSEQAGAAAAAAAAAAPLQHGWLAACQAAAASRAAWLALAPQLAAVPGLTQVFVRGVLTSVEAGRGLGS